MFSQIKRPFRIAMADVCTLAAACALWIGCSAWAQPVQNQFADGSQTLTVTFPNDCPAHYGFHPVKIIAVNPGNKAVSWDIKISEEGMGRETMNSTGHRERIEVPPRRSVERELMVVMGKQEPHSWSYRQVEVVMPSGIRSSWNPSNPGSGYGNDHGLKVPALITKDASERVRSTPGQSDAFHGMMHDPALAPGDWRGYTVYGLVILTPADWQAMSPAARAALGDWTRLGGHLQFIGRMPDDAPAPDVQGTTARGLGSVHAFAESDPSFSRLPAGQAAVRSQLMAAGSVSTGEHATLRPWLQRMQPDLLLDRFTIWPMVLVLIAFFVMITPINLFVLAPSRRRHRLFRTIPLISLSACVLLALAVLFGDGLGGKGQRLVWIESRPGTENRQFITQWQSSRCGALIGTDFTIPDAAYLAPMRNLGSKVSLLIQEDRLEAGGGWFTSRANQSHFLQAARPGRGRIEWSAKDANAPTAVSTFEFPLRDVYVMRDDGSIWYASVMRQGETTPLHAVDGKEVKGKLEAELDQMPQVADMTKLAGRPGHFIAFTDQPPAIQSLGSVRWKDTGVVTGALAHP